MRPAMGNKASDPVDHARTTRKHAGQNMKNTKAFPALIGIGLGVLALVIGIFGFAAGHPPLGIAGVVIALALWAAGFGWLARERRRVRRVEAEYVRTHPGADWQPPAS
jgi:Flp pilus assembly protein TadB